MTRSVTNSRVGSGGGGGGLSVSGGALTLTGALTAAQATVSGPVTATQVAASSVAASDVTASNANVVSLCATGVANLAAVETASLRADVGNVTTLRVPGSLWAYSSNLATTLRVSGNATFAANATVGGTLAAACVFSQGALLCAGQSLFGGTAAFGGDASFGGNVDFIGNLFAYDHVKMLNYGAGSRVLGWGGASSEIASTRICLYGNGGAGTFDPGATDLMGLGMADAVTMRLGAPTGGGFVFRANTVTCAQVASGLSTFAGDVAAAGNLTLSGAKMLFTANTTTGNTGVQFVSAQNSYNGPLIERRQPGSATERYGVGVYSGGPARLYSSGAYGPASVRLGWPTAESTFVDALTCTRAGSLTTATTSNVGINTTGPVQAFHVVGNCQFDAQQVLITGGSTAGNAGIQFGNAAYSGALVEGRTSATSRYGVGMYGTTSRVYAAGQAGAARVCLGFAQSDTTFLDAVTVMPAGASAGATVSNVGVNTASPAAALHVVGNCQVDGNVLVNGTLYASGEITAMSDARVKADLRVIDAPLAKTMTLTGYTYSRTDLPSDAPRQAGLLAQDLERALPEAVVPRGDLLSVSYAPVAALLVEAVKELEARVAALEAGATTSA